MSTQKKVSKISLSMKKKSTTPKIVRLPAQANKAQILSDVLVQPPSISCQHIKQQPPQVLPITSLPPPNLPLLDDQYSIITIHSDDESGARETQIRALTVEDSQLSQLTDGLDASSTVQQTRVYVPQILSPALFHPPAWPVSSVTSLQNEQYTTTTTTSMAYMKRPRGKSIETMLQVYGVGPRPLDDEEFDCPTAAAIPKQVAQATYARLLKMAPVYESRILEARERTQVLSMEFAASRENEAVVQGEVEYLNKLMTFLVNNM